MSIYTVLWILWGLAFCGIEGVALFNKGRGDTLSEHLWAWLGIRDDFWHKDRRDDWPTTVTDDDGVTTTLPPKPKPVTPKWTLRLARIVFLSATLWLALHIATGGWV